jgi:hypothetical protein
MTDGWRELGLRQQARHQPIGQRLAPEAPDIAPPG